MICAGALELCQRYNIIHRDIKPENIFVSDTGDFKLGDFGIARTVEKTTSGLSKKGTYTYMAPEVYKGEAYGSTVDIYSLGIVLYRLLNGNRTPFLPAAPAPITHADRENALARRFSGSPLPAPSHAEGRLAEIVQKACAYDPRERYSSPMQMRQELESILYSREESRYIYPEGDDVPQDSVHYVKTGEEPPVAETEAPQRDLEADEKDDGAADKYGDTVSDFGGTAKWVGDGTARPRRNLKIYLAAGLILNVFGLYFAEVYYQWRNGIRTPGWQKILLTGFVLFNMVMCTIFGGLLGMLSGIFVFGILLLIPFCLKKYFPRQTDM